jgi:hypothetical protein
MKIYLTQVTLGWNSLPSFQRYGLICFSIHSQALYATSVPPLASIFDAARTSIRIGMNLPQGTTEDSLAKHLIYMSDLFERQNLLQRLDVLIVTKLTAQYLTMGYKIRHIISQNVVAEHDKSLDVLLGSPTT